MNFLAHLYLSGDDENILFGNFIADSVKGSNYKKYPEEIQKGILLHRFIDHFTDTHEIVKQDQRLLKPDFHHYSGIIIDIIYDHLLAKNWEQFHTVSLRHYTEKVQQELGKHRTEMPDKARLFYDYMISFDRLFSYREKSEIAIVLKRMGQRIHAPYNLADALKIVEENFEAYETHFLKFFREIIVAVQEYQSKW